MITTISSRTKARALLETVDQEAVQVFGSVQLLVYQALVIVHANFGCSQPVKARGEHVTEKLDGVVGTFDKLIHFDGDALQFVGLAAEIASGEDATAVLRKVVYRA